MTRFAGSEKHVRSEGQGGSGDRCQLRHRRGHRRPHVHPRVQGGTGGQERGEAGGGGGEVRRLLIIVQLDTVM